MTGADIRRAITLGAKAAQMGTAFLCSSEAGTSAIHRKYLLNNQDRVTKITNAFSGRPARGIDNTFIKIMKNEPTLPFPAQNSFTANLRKTSEIMANGEFVSHWAGENFKKIRNLSCSQILQELKIEFESG
jgi:nitronate monooxygenase